MSVAGIYPSDETPTCSEDGHDSVDKMERPVFGDNDEIWALNPEYELFYCPECVADTVVENDVSPYLLERVVLLNNWEAWERADPRVPTEAFQFIGYGEVQDESIKFEDAVTEDSLPDWMETPSGWKAYKQV